MYRTNYINISKDMSKTKKFVFNTTETTPLIGNNVQKQYLSAKNSDPNVEKGNDKVLAETLIFRNPLKIVSLICKFIFFQCQLIMRNKPRQFQF